MSLSSLLWSLLLRAVGLACLALLQSRVEAAFAPRFLLVHTGLLGLLTSPLVFFEWGVVSSLSHALGRCWTTLLAGALAFSSGLLLVGYVPLIRSMGIWLVPAVLALSAALPPLLVPTPVLGSRTAAALSCALYLCLAFGLVVADPERRYGARYRENRSQDLGETKRSPVGPSNHGVDPDSLSDPEIARAIAHAYMGRHAPEGLRWSWEEAVALYGLVSYAKDHGDGACLDFVRRFAAAHHDEAMETALWADSIAPTIALLLLPTRETVPAHAALIARVDASIRSEVPRTHRGALSHPGRLLGGALPRQAWVDSLFMVGVYLNVRALLPGGEWALAESSVLDDSIAEHLRDSTTGLYRHASMEVGPFEIVLPVEPMFWGRGNGWAAYYLAHQIHTRRALGLPSKPKTVDRLLRLLESASRVEDPATGRFPTDLSRQAGDKNPLETSVTALMASSIQLGILAGVVPSNGPLSQVAARARRGLRDQLRWDGDRPTLLGTSTATHPGFRAFYGSIPHDENVGHGIGSVLLALSTAPNQASAHP